MGALKGAQRKPVGLGVVFVRRWQLSRDLKGETENSSVWRHCEVGWWVGVNWRHGEEKDYFVSWCLPLSLPSFLPLLHSSPSLLPFFPFPFLLSSLRFNPGIMRGRFRCIAIRQFGLYPEGNRWASGGFLSWKISWSDLNFITLENGLERDKKLGNCCS